MRLKVTRKSRFGFQAEGHEGWFNADRNAAPDLSSIEVGMTLEVEANGKYVRSFSIVGGETNDPQPIVHSVTNNRIATGDNNRGEVITRLSVIKAVLTATGSYTEPTRDRLIQKYVEYALTGNMPSVPQPENHPFNLGAELPSMTSTAIRSGLGEVVPSQPSSSSTVNLPRRGRPSRSDNGERLTDD